MASTLPGMAKKYTDSPILIIATVCEPQPQREQATSMQAPVSAILKSAQACQAKSKGLQQPGPWLRQHNLGLEFLAFCSRPIVRPQSRVLSHSKAEPGRGSNAAPERQRRIGAWPPVPPRQQRVPWTGVGRSRRCAACILLAEGATSDPWKAHSAWQAAAALGGFLIPPELQLS